VLESIGGEQHRSIARACGVRNSRRSPSACEPAAAPSHVSALMSGVMTKLAVYGFVRLVFDLAGPPAWWWSVPVLLIAGITALLGVLYALMEHDLLFMGSGAVLNATGERDMEHLGGLIHRMPITALAFLAGCIAISALPPFNGFVSEWLGSMRSAMRFTMSNASVFASWPHRAMRICCS
jgi:formate hydrogenlyase subunit 3/multisubunit Na+/H+ antiporter MnhD subunit